MSVALFFTPIWEAEKQLILRLTLRLASIFLGCSWIGVIVGGVAEPLSDKEVSDYFQSRPTSSQLAAWASKQSSPIASRETLEAQFDAVQQRFGSGDIPLPEFWGGYRVVPEEFEFWQGGEDRLHDRFSFQRIGDSWKISRLSP